LGSKRIQEKNNEKETVIIDEVTRTTVQDVRPVVESDSQLRSRDTGEPTEKIKRQAESAAELEDIETGNELNNERDDNEEYNDTQVMESDSVLTEEKKKSMQSLRKKKIFFLKQ